jgi:hypothetical protein
VPVVSQDKRTGKYVVDLSRFHDIELITAQPPARRSARGKKVSPSFLSVQANDHDDDRLI